MDAPDTSSQSARSPAARRSAEAIVSGRAVDMAGVPFRLVAADVRRAEAVDALLGALPDTDREPVVALRLVADAPAVPRREPDETITGLDLWRDGARLVVRHHAGLAAVVDDDGVWIGGDADDLQLPFRRIFLAVATHVLVEHGRYLLHAGAVADDAGAVLVLGHSGQGKSTLVLAALHAGWRVLGDDLAVLVPGEPPTVVGIPRPVAVPPDVLAGPIEADAAPLVGDVRGRVTLPVEVVDPSPAPVRALLAVARGAGPRGELHPVAPSALLGHALDAFGAVGDARTLRRFFPHAVALSRLPGHRLEHATDPEARLSEAGRLLGSLASLAGHQ